MKSVVVDRQSATIKILRGGVVIRELPYRIISDDTVIVGNKLFSGPPPTNRWGEEEEGRGKKRRRRAELNGWDMKEWDHPTFMPSPAPVFRWSPPGPREQYRSERDSLNRQIALAKGDEESRELVDELLDLGVEEKERKKLAQRQSIRKRLPKTERKKYRGPKPSEQQLPTGGEERGKKKKGKKKGGESGGDNKGGPKGRKKK